MDRVSKPNASQTGKLRSYLAQMDIDPKDANEIVKMAKTRGQIADNMAAHLRTKQPRR